MALRLEPGLRPAAWGGASERASTGPDVDPIRVLVIDPETAFTRVVGRRADDLGWDHDVLVAPPMLDELVRMRPAAIVLDADSCPGGPWELIGDVAAALPDAGLLVVSHQSTVAERVRALRLGADDWITKPVHPDEVMARLGAVARRSGGPRSDATDEPTVAGELRIRPDRFQAYVGDESVRLTRREYELVELLANADGRVLEREEIYMRVWGYSMVRGDRSVDVFVRKVRAKLVAASPGWRYVHTHFGVGYRFEPEPAADDR
jgi:DNA-binding response OmpR family regulator